MKDIIKRSDFNGRMSPFEVYEKYASIILANTLNADSSYKETVSKILIRWPDELIRNIKNEEASLKNPIVLFYVNTFLKKGNPAEYTYDVDSIISKTLGLYEQEKDVKKLLQILMELSCELCMDIYEDNDKFNIINQKLLSTINSYAFEDNIYKKAKRLVKDKVRFKYYFTICNYESMIQNSNVVQRYLKLQSLLYSLTKNNAMNDLIYILCVERLIPKGYESLDDEIHAFLECDEQIKDYKTYVEATSNCIKFANNPVEYIKNYMEEKSSPTVKK